MRHRHGVLLDGSGGPEGGQWSFDHANPKPWPGKPATPPDTRPEHDYSLLWETIVAANVKSFGNPQASAVRWPLHRAEALAAPDTFIATSLPQFGDYEDAMSTRSPHLFHSLMSFALNTKMIGPREVVQRTEAADRTGAVPLAAAEGFIRQVLG